MWLQWTRQVMLLVGQWTKLLIRGLVEVLQIWEFRLMRVMLLRWTIRTHQIQMRHRMRLIL
jgi:hypothetical protein